MISTRTQFRNACYALTACAVMVSGVLLAFAAITANAATTAATTATKTSTASSSTSSPSLGYTLGTLPDSVVYNDFVVGPGKIEIDLNPGESRTVELTIANRLGTEKTFNVTEEDFVGSDNLNQPVVLLGDDRSPYSLKDFVHIPASAVPSRRESLFPRHDIHSGQCATRRPLWQRDRFGGHSARFDHLAG